jgi:autophagy-related protein 9
MLNMDAYKESLLPKDNQIKLEISDNIVKCYKVDDIDKFFVNIYKYFVGSGFRCCLLNTVLDYLSNLFILVFTITITICLDYDLLFTTYNISQSLTNRYIKESGNCQFYLVIFVFILLWDMFVKFVNIWNIFKVRDIYHNILNIDESDIKLLKWEDIVSKLVENKDSCKFNNPLFTITPLNVANCIMRKDNYLIGLFHSEILDIHFDIPFIGSRTFLSKYMEWNISHSIFGYFFVNDCLKVKFLNCRENPEQIAMFGEELKKRFYLVGILSIIMFPFVCPINLICVFFRHAEQFRRNTIVNVSQKREWSKYSRWKFREYNELNHLLDERLDRSNEYVDKYIASFPTPMINAISRFFIFIIGSVVSVLTVLTLYDEKFIHVELTENGSVLWYMGVFSFVLYLLKGVINNGEYSSERGQIMRNIKGIVEYIPNSWIEEPNNEEARSAIMNCYISKKSVIMNEVIDVIITPIVFCFKLPQLSDLIVEYFVNFTHYDEKIGYICSSTLLQGENNIDKKMENSYRNFAKNYPNWYQQDNVGSVNLGKSDLLLMKNINSLYEDVSSSDDSDIRRSPR